MMKFKEFIEEKTKTPAKLDTDEPKKGKVTLGFPPKKDEKKKEVPKK